MKHDFSRFFNDLSDAGIRFLEKHMHHSLNQEKLHKSLQNYSFIQFSNCKTIFLNIFSMKDSIFKGLSDAFFRLPKFNLEIEMYLKNYIYFYFIELHISQKLPKQLISNFDTLQFNKFTNFYC